MNQLSAVVITHNEASNIERCVKALLQVAPEVLIIDSNSSDQTGFIARKLGAKVIETEWKGYAGTKNYGNSLATYDWILSIDADEELSTELIQTINHLKLEDQTVYALDRLTNFCGQWIKHSGWYPEWKVRIFQKQYTNWEGAFVHEELRHTSTVNTKKLKGKLFHYSYKTKEDHLRRIERYAKLSAQKLYAQGKQSNFIKLWLSPIVRFLKTIFIKRAFLDGRNGWLISIGNAKLVHLKYKRLRQLYQEMQSRS